MLETAVLVSALPQNTSSSDYDKFKLYDKVSAITIVYKDERLPNISIKNITSTSIIYQFIYRYELLIGDKIQFTIYPNGSSTSKIVEVELTQYEYTF